MVVQKYGGVKAGPGGSPTLLSGSLPDGRRQADQWTESLGVGRALSAFVKLGTIGPGIRPMPTAARLLAHTWRDPRLGFKDNYKGQG